MATLAAVWLNASSATALTRDPLSFVQQRILLQGGSLIPASSVSMDLRLYLPINVQTNQSQQQQRLFTVEFPQDSLVNQQPASLVAILERMAANADATVPAEYWPLFTSRTFETEFIQRLLKTQWQLRQTLHFEGFTMEYQQWKWLCFAMSIGSKKRGHLLLLSPLPGNQSANVSSLRPVMDGILSGLPSDVQYKIRENQQERSKESQIAHLVHRALFTLKVIRQESIIK